MSICGYTRRCLKSSNAVAKAILHLRGNIVCVCVCVRGAPEHITDVVTERLSGFTCFCCLLFVFSCLRQMGCISNQTI